MIILPGKFSRVVNLIFGYVLLLLLAMPAAAEEAALDCSSKSIDDAFKVSKVDIKKIQIDLKAVGYHPGEIDGFFGPDTKKALKQFCLSFKVNELLQQEAEKDAEIPIGKLATKIESLLNRIGSESEPREILLNGGGCGCSRDFGDNSMVYGFYPYWLADGKEHVVDFSLFNRIGYFALKLDHEGDIVEELHLPREASAHPNIAELVKTARKHRVKVDVTFIMPGWQAWGDVKGENENDRKKEKRFETTVENAVNNIIETVTQEYERATSLWWRKYMPLVENYSTVSVDGINLYFPDYGESKDGIKLVKIVKELKGRLNHAKSDARLNIMLGIDLMDVDSRRVFTDREKKPLKPVQIGNEYKELEERFRNLEKRFQVLGEILDAEPKVVDHVFLYLTQDTSQSKKDLRQVIENAFRGEARRTVLRKIVPIVVAQGLGEKKVAERIKAIEEAGDSKPEIAAAKKRDSQFEDDLIYLQDNFAGVGLWHLPLSQDDEAAKAEIAEKEAAQEETAKKEEEAIKAAEKDAEAKAAAAEVAADNVKVAEIVAAEAAADDTEIAKSELDTAKKDEELKKAAAEVAQEKVDNLKKAAEEAASKKAEAEKQKPLPDAETIRLALMAKYLPGGEFAFLGDTIQPYATDVCDYACPNRWQFRVALDVLLGLALIYALLAMWYCRLRELYRRQLSYFLGFGFLTAAVFTITAVCDPYLRDRAEFALIVILLVIIAYLVWLRRRKTAHLP